MGSPLTPSFLFDLESNMRVITAREYERLNAKTWWRNVAKEVPSSSKRERFVWLIDSSGIQYEDRLGGSVEFEELAANTTEYESKAATAGLTLSRAQLEDHDGNGVQLAAHWSRQQGAYAAYWPQKQIAAAIRDNGLTYDGQNMFDVDHPVNPFDTSLGTFRNDLTGAASGIYPGAVPIDVSVTIDVAFVNLGKAIAYVQGGLKMPNGQDPRMLQVVGIMGPSALVPRMQQLTNARYIAQAAASGGASGDIEAVVRNWGLGQPIEAPELGSPFTNGSDTTYYLITQQLGGDDLGAFQYINREPFSIVYNTGMTDAALQRANELQWVNRGRNVVGLGHPYLLFRCKAA